MAEITITIKDNPDGSVSIKSDPNYAVMLKIEYNRLSEKLTPAHGYAIALINKALEISRQNNPNALIKLPKIIKPH
jgi:hypothetical protein